MQYNPPQECEEHKSENSEKKSIQKDYVTRICFSIDGTREVRIPCKAYWDEYLTCLNMSKEDFLNNKYSDFRRYISDVLINYYESLIEELDQQIAQLDKQMSDAKKQYDENIDKYKVISNSLVVSFVGTIVYFVGFIVVQAVFNLENAIYILIYGL